jgi:methyl-accepting chemotaxis protein
MKLKIKLLLPALFGCVVVLGLIQGGIALKSLMGLEWQAKQMERYMMGAIAISALDKSLADLGRYHASLLTAADADEVKLLSEQIATAKEKRDGALGAFSKRVTLAETRAKYDKLVADMKHYDKISAEILTRAGAGERLSLKSFVVGNLDPISSEASEIVGAIVSNNARLAVISISDSADVTFAAKMATAVGLAIATLIALGAAALSFFKIARPITVITSAMNSLAEGNNDLAVPYTGRSDEIGEMAGAVAVFRTNALERARLEAETEANRTMSEQERIDREEQKAREAADLAFAIDGLGRGLKGLSDGDMTVRLNDQFSGQLDQLRMNFNESVAKLQSALRSVGENARMIDAGANEIRDAAEDLSRRTEQQAASVEETAAALEQVTTAVKDSSQRANEAGNLADRTRQGAERSGEIVRQAVAAMEAIEASSGEINNIIGVIDDIAFQTNLLALNAGVEAARAGDAGKGFAVVAQEVRELAQRSANAAQELKGLITASGDRVRDGVSLVNQTGEALHTIVSEVQTVNENVAIIVVSSREQSTGLTEINSSVNLMDQGTQQNAAMVEQTTAASHSLATQAAALTALLAQFKLDNGSRSAGVRPAVDLDANGQRHAASSQYRASRAA